VTTRAEGRHTSVERAEQEAGANRKRYLRRNPGWSTDCRAPILALSPITLSRFSMPVPSSENEESKFLLSHEIE
jgi:hypothetical protein